VDDRHARRERRDAGRLELVEHAGPEEHEQVGLPHQGVSRLVLPAEVGVVGGESRPLEAAPVLVQDGRPELLAQVHQPVERPRPRDLAAGHEHRALGGG
jgi:hypothetical protein